MTYEKDGLFVDDAHMESFGENCARGLHPARPTPARTLATALENDLRELERLHAAYAAQERPTASGAVRWLLDNAWLLRREGLAAAREFRQVDWLQGAVEGPMLQALCRGLLRSGLAALSEGRTVAFLRGVQRQWVLDSRELFLFPAGIKAALAEALLALYRSGEAETDPPAAESRAEALFSAFRLFSSWDMGTMLEAVDLTEQLLRKDPAGIYPQMAEESRRYYRGRLSKLARKYRMREHRAAELVLSLAQKGKAEQSHVGYWILNRPLGQAAAKRNGGFYIGSNVLLTLALALAPALALQTPALFFLLLLPVSEAVKQLIDFVLLRIVPPAQIPRLELAEGIPPEGRTLCVISSLLEREEDAANLIRHLEDCRLLSRDAGPELGFALLADLPDSDADPYPGQEALLRAAAEGVENLNLRYGGGFFLLIRPRQKTQEGRWSGWERKRGALLETMLLLRDRESTVTVAAGDRKALAGTRYLLALDSDTRLSPCAAKKLVGAALHPLNRPRVTGTLVTEGYGILSPRIATELSAAGKSDFSRVLAGPGGMDPYGGVCSDLSMDLWRRGGFYGKGLLHIDAYLRCMGDRVPEGQMLSHDSVECAFLRGGFLSDVECSDGFPSSLLSYYSRLERWTRGDWQNLPWLFRLGKALPRTERWKLFDALRRSLCPAATLAALALGFLLPGGLAAAGLAALLALLAELLLTAAAALTRREGTGHFQSVVFVGFGGGMVRTLLQLLFLPAGAAVRFSAICRALWRLLISKRHLLDWRTAAQGESSGNLVRYYRQFWFSPVLGLALTLFSPTVLGKAAGVLWTMAPLCALLLSLPVPTPAAPRRRDRQYLLGCARDTWEYFSRFLRPEDHWLPPDNEQVQPPVGTARRTSPTNIGLALLSVLAAADLRFIPRERAGVLIGHSLDSLEALPKWRGHLYNWYDTQTLSALSPRYVSTVDSGNLCACLIALAEGLREYGREDLAERAEALERAMDFSPLFDPKRKLFSIGFDPEQGHLTASWYDLMSSEARLAAYVAVARGDVPPDHWRALSRAQVASGLYHGMASWTGTMFEYLMPELLLPLCRDSLFYETARFCLYVQQRRAGREHPWGVSESAYGALDPSMNYRYKAHGCAGLALRPGMDDEFVVSPYSSFLALAVRPAAALRNLRRLEALGMRGEYGFWEALDYSSSRQYQLRPAVVRCVMAHHQGMSLLACANALEDGVMRRRFLSRPAMRAFRGLLEERLPVGVPLLRRREPESRPEPPQPQGAAWSETGEGTNFLLPRCCLLAGPSYSLIAAETGLTRALWGAISPYASPASPLDFTFPSRGVDLFLDAEGRRLPLLPSSDPPPGVRYSWVFNSTRAEFHTSAEGLSAVAAVTVSAGETGENRRLTLKNEGTTERAGMVVLRFRPLLARMEDYESHPAFSGLGISARVERGCLLLRRLPRGNTGELWLCLSASLPCEYDLDPGGAGRRGPLYTVGEEERFLTDPLVQAFCPVSLAGGEERELRFSLALSHSSQGALASAHRMLAEEAEADLPLKAAAVTGMGPEELEAAYAILPRLCFPPMAAMPCRQEELWRFGISGDLPLVCVPYHEETELETARKLMNCHLFLCGCGMNFDLVFLSRDGAGYHKPLQTALSDALWRQGGELLRDRRGGVHILEEVGGGPVLGMAALVTKPGQLPRREQNPRVTTLRFPDENSRLPIPQAPPPCRWGENGEFSFEVHRSLPRRAWQHMLTNGRMGYIATGSGCGTLWYQNARENQLTPWTGLARAVGGPERIFVRWQRLTYSLFAAPDYSRCTVTYLPAAAVWETRFGPFFLRATAFIPLDTDARVLLLHCEGPLAEAELHWQMELRLCGSSSGERCCKPVYGGGFLSTENPWAMAGAKAFLAGATGGIQTYTFDKAAALTLNYNEQAPETAPVFAAKLPLAADMALVCGCCDAGELLRFTAPGEAQRALDRTLAQWGKLHSRLHVQTGHAALDRYLNGWAAYQTMACRLLGRCSLYQSGGAYGFRDQLQDAVNLLLLDPSPARAQILRCCGRQYLEGDVQHWWHEGGASPRGVRTRCSDDLLWLPWALCEYVEKTGDATLCEETVPYLQSPPLLAEEGDRYETAETSGRQESVLRHCLRAVEEVMRRGTGAHGLLPIGSGDWNDGFSALGDGESVWLSWFFLLTADRFVRLLETAPGMEKERQDIRSFCDSLAARTEEAWDGAWYRRGYYGSAAEGKPLGSAASAECCIDSIAQSFALLSGRAEPGRAKTALRSAFERLYDREHRLVKLFTPPFAGKEHPGYIASYGPGFRENGGQYTHGAVWLVQALFRAGMTEEGWELLEALLPGDRDPEIYQGEPYVLAADVYTAPGHEGEAGWTWYTGAAGWLLRTAAEELLGLHQRNGALTVAPRLPKALDSFHATVAGTEVEVGPAGVRINGVPWDGTPIPLRPTPAE